MADLEDLSSSSDDEMHIVIDPSLDFNDIDDSGSIQGDNTMDTGDNASEPSKDEPCLQVGQEHETQAQMQETQAQMQETQAQMQETQAQMQETQVQMQETRAQMQETQVQMYDTQGHMATAYTQETQETQTQAHLLTAHVQEVQETHAQVLLPTAYMREMQAHRLEPPPLLYHRPQQHVEPPPLHQPSTSRACSDIIVRAGPSWAEASDLDHMMRNRPRAGNDQRISRRAPYDPYYRETSGSAALRKRRFVRQQGLEFESQPRPLHIVQEYPAPEVVQYNAVRRSLNITITPESSPQTFYPRIASQYSPQSPPKLVPISATRNSPRSSPLHTPRSSPLQSPRNTPRSSPLHTPRYSPQYTPHSPDAASAGPSEVPSASDDAPLPLYLTLLPREAPTLITISQTSSSRRTETRVLVRSTPRTHTVTSTVNTAVFYPYELLPHLPLVTEESNQSTSRIEQYTSCSDHLLNRPTTHQERTPVELCLEYQNYLDNVDHTEEVHSTDCDSLIDAIRSLDTTPAPANRPPPRITIVPLVTPVLSPETTTTSSPPRTSSS